MNPSPSRCRIGLVVDGWPPHAWQVRLLDELARAAEVLVFSVPPDPAAPRAWPRLADKVPGLRRKECHTPAHPVDSPQAALAACHAADVDLVVDVGGVPATGPYRFRRGLWTLRQGDGRAVGAPYAFLDEIASRRPEPVVLLVCDGAREIRSARPLVARGHYAASLERLLAAAAVLPVGALRMGEGSARAWSPRARRRAVSPAAALAFAGWLKAFDRGRAWTTSESWMLGIIDKPIQSVCTADLRSAVHWVGPREHSRYWADPFGMPGDPTHVYCEEVLHDHPTGVLKELTLDGDRVVAEREVGVSVSGHLSYPFLFDHEGATWCIPESGAAGKVVIHRLDPATREWTPVCTALSGLQAVDTTLFLHGGLLWIAYSDAQFGVHDSLCLAWAERITGPWHTHPLNPVKIDARSSRPAGTVFLRDGHMLRPGQDCSHTYGGAVALNRVDVCTPDDYRETTIEFIRPCPGTRNPHGVHTLSAWGDRTLVDAKREWMNPWVIRYKARKRLGLLRGPRPLVANPP